MRNVLTKLNMKRPERPAAGVKSGFLSPNLITKIVLLLLLALFLILVYQRSNAKDISLTALEQSFEQETKISDMSKCSDRQLLEFFQLDARDYEEFLYYKTDEALGVDELLVLKAAQPEDLDEAYDACESHVDDLIKTYEGYGPEQVARLEKAVILRRGVYLFYCVAEDTDPYEEVFTNAL